MVTFIKDKNLRFKMQEAFVRFQQIYINVQKEILNLIERW